MTLTKDYIKITRPASHGRQNWQEFAMWGKWLGEGNVLFISGVFSFLKELCTPWPYCFVMINTLSLQFLFLCR